MSNKSADFLMSNHRMDEVHGMELSRRSRRHKQGRFQISWHHWRRAVRKWKRS